MSALLEVEGVAKRFGGVTAVDDCSLEVAEGTVTALIGPNGSGKTTLFNVVTGYLPADAGAVRFGGRRFDRPDPARLYRSGLTRTFQQARVFASLTLVENLVAAIHQSWRSLLRARMSASGSASCSSSERCSWAARDSCCSTSRPQGSIPSWSRPWSATCAGCTRRASPSSSSSTT
jgi:ABC-type branched-subunit amino acid transport system ATPase component